MEENAGKEGGDPEKNDVRLPAVIMGTVLILILCGREILTVGIGGDNRTGSRKSGGRELPQRQLQQPDGKITGRNRHIR